MAKQPQQPTNATGSLEEVLGAVAQALKEFTRVVGSLAPPAPAAALAGPSAQQGGTGTAGVAAAAGKGGGAGAAAGAVALGAALGIATRALQDFVAATRTFVGAFNPGAIEALDTAFRNLQATIGYALEPIIHALTKTFRLLGGEIESFFTSLRPIISEFAGAFVNIATPAIHALGTVLRLFMEGIQAALPLLRLWATWLEGVVSLGSVLLEIFQVLNPIRLLFNALAEALGGLEVAIAFVQAGFVAMAVGLIQATDSLLRFVGATKLADKLLNSFARAVREGGRAAAPKDFSIGSIEEVYRKRLLAAAQAQSGPNLTKTESLLEKIKVAVEKMAEQRGVKIERDRPLGNRWPKRNELDGAEGGEGDGGTF